MAPTQLAYRAVADRLRHDILAGRLDVGQRLPAEAELCDRFGVSRSTVREALRLLASSGMLTTSRGVHGGTAVARPAPDDVASMLRDSLLLLTRGDGATVDELLETRELLEIPTARLAAVRRTEEQLALLREAIPPAPEALDSGEIFGLNRSFHKLLLDAAGNRMLSIVTEPLFSVLQRRFLRDNADPAFWEEVADDHRRILRAVERRDADRAGREMARHLKHLRRTYRHLDRTTTKEG